MKFVKLFATVLVIGHSTLVVAAETPENNPGYEARINEMRRDRIVAEEARRQAAAEAAARRAEAVARQAAAIKAARAEISEQTVARDMKLVNFRNRVSPQLGELGQGTRIIRRPTHVLIYEVMRNGQTDRYVVEYVEQLNEMLNQIDSLSPDTRIRVTEMPIIEFHDLKIPSLLEEASEGYRLPRSLVLNVATERGQTIADTLYMRAQSEFSKVPGTRQLNLRDPSGDTKISRKGFLLPKRAAGAFRTIGVAAPFLPLLLGGDAESPGPAE